MIILGSQSPRRKEILEFFSVPFRQVSSDFDETLVTFHGNPAAYVCECAERKAMSLADRFKDEIILTADTTVYRNGRLFMKPESQEEAFAMLKELAGKEHTVLTGICVARNSERFVDVEESRVLFHELSDSQIKSYHRQINCLDKAGSYAVQKGGNIIVKRIEGCYYNIMGLPLDATRRALLKMGIDLWDYLKPD